MPERHPMQRIIVLGALLLGLIGNARAADFSALLQRLDTMNFRTKTAVIRQLADSGSPRALPVLRALLSDSLVIRTSDHRIVIVQGSDANPTLVDAASGKVLGPAQEVDTSPVVINLLMRRQLHDIIARLSLQNPDPAIRLAAVQQLTGDLHGPLLAQLKTDRTREHNPRVRHAMDVAIALAGLDSGTASSRIEAIRTLAGTIDDSVRNALRQASTNTSEPAAVRQAAATALAHIQRKLQLYGLIERGFFGLSLGSVLLLAAIGLAITFGVMGVINMAHGELIMLGAYTTYLVQQALPGLIDWSLLLAIPAAFVVSGLFGIAIERSVIRFLYGRPLETLLATFGLSLILQQLVRTTISAQNVPVTNPAWMSGSWAINNALELTWNRLYIIAFALLAFLSLVLILRYTALGLKLRAVTQNRDMARAMGIRTDWIDALTFGLGAGIAGIAGVALSQLTNVGPNLGQSYIIDAFMVVVFGGVGNLWGTLVGAFTLGIANVFLEPYAGAVLAKILVLVFIILFIQKRPRGLFALKGRVASA